MTKPKSGRFPWMKFKVRSWLSDVELNSCSIGAQGLWIKLICFIHEADAGGYLLIGGKVPSQAQLARAAGITERECTALERELEEAGVFSRREMDGAIYCRKTVRESDPNGAPEGDPEDALSGSESNPSRARSLSLSSSDSPKGVQGDLHTGVDNPVDVCVEHWRREWGRTRSGTRATVREKDRAAVAWMLEQEAPEIVRARMTAILEDSEPFVLKHASLRLLESKWDAYAVAASKNGHAKPPAETAEERDVRERWTSREFRNARTTGGVRDYPGFDVARRELGEDAKSGRVVA